MSAQVLLPAFLADGLPTPITQVWGNATRKPNCQIVRGLF